MAPHEPPDPAYLGWRLDALDEWRRQIEHRLSVAEEKLNHMTTTDLLARELAKERSRHRGQMFSRAEKLWALAYGGIISACTIAALILQARGHR